MPQDLAAFARQRQAMFLAKSDIDVADESLRQLRTRTETTCGVTAALASRAFRQAMGVQPQSIELLKEQGTYHQLFLVTSREGRRWVLRANALNDSGRNYLMHQENHVTQLVRAQGIPCPRVVHTDVTRTVVPFDYQVIEYVSGDTLRAYDADESRLAPLLEDLGKTVARLHQIEMDGWGYPDCRLSCLPENPETPVLRGGQARWSEYLHCRLKQHVAVCREVAVISAYEATAILSLFSECGPLLDQAPSRLLHGDLGNHNIFTDGTNITGLIDWEDCLIGDPVYDVAFWATFHPVRRHAAFLAGYQAVAALPDDFELRFWLSYLRASLAKTVHRHRFGYQDHPNRPPASQRIQLSLDHLRAA